VPALAQTDACSVAAGERLRNYLSAGVATVMAQARQHLGVALAGKNRADDPQAGRASDVGADVVELEIHLCQRLLHMLDMRGRVLRQTLADARRHAARRSGL
jgi:hypothetical protein